MAQPWIHRPITDSIFILVPSFFVVAFVFLFQDFLVAIERYYSFYTWLFLIVFIDVSHVYATLFKTYFVPENFQKQKKLLIALPIICFVVGLILYGFGSLIFWSVLAYIAVFHFIRQQYGFMRLYSRLEKKTNKSILFDNLIIYTATIYPMFHWFLSSKKKFNWFVENEFVRFENSELLDYLSIFYFTILTFYISKLLFDFTKNRYFNFPKNAIIIGTFLSWYFGIVYFNNDLIFTLLNVVSHGIPYMALVFLKEIDAKKQIQKPVFIKQKSYKQLFLFVLSLFVFAFSEEFLWEILVWNDNFSVINFNLSGWHFLLVPLLTVPQFTHYLLDGFIWKTRKEKTL